MIIVKLQDSRSKYKSQCYFYIFIINKTEIKRIIKLSSIKSMKYVDLNLTKELQSTHQKW